MSLHNVTSGPKAPDEFNVIIEIPMNFRPDQVRWMRLRALFVDRFMIRRCTTPATSGYIPNTLSDDDPVDVLVITPVR